MSTEILIKKLESLPEALQHQVSDFVDFLFQRHFQIEEEEATPLSESEKLELDRRYAAYQANPESAVQLDELKDELLNRYGI